MSKKRTIIHEKRPVNMYKETYEHENRQTHGKETCKHEMRQHTRKKRPTNMKTDKHTEKDTYKNENRHEEKQHLLANAK